ncbi:MAG TPA: SLC13 family permease, partial [Longimicrobiales bacterium]|nr:SLC13 family permease [Longimicrobiales bacterium]
ETASRLGLEAIRTDGEPPEGPAELREAVIPEGSILEGERVDQVDFRERYGAVVLGVVRRARQLPDTPEVVLRPGDTLLLVTGPGFQKAYGDSREFHVTGGEEVEPESLADVALWRPTEAKAGMLVLAAIVLLAATGVLHISLAALGGAVVMVATGMVSPAEARRSVDWSVLIVIGAAIGLGTALTESGAAQLVAGGIVSLGEPLGPRGVLLALLLAAMVFTLVITNNAVVAILFPVAVSVAEAQTLDPRPFVVAVTVAASLAFATPLGYQTNLMVYGPGGYRFRDFVRAGLPLQLLLGLVAVGLVPWLWPF